MTASASELRQHPDLLELHQYDFYWHDYPVSLLTPSTLKETSEQTGEGWCLELMAVLMNVQSEKEQVCY